ncbi:MAG: carboxylating nicotinate-nucleotide diphosphorylase [Candidatus Marinimicrobia bacterium]|nr:carboxylating nicotinate-nucleotide diphosphorylase [Candidatus Neomarinimicrobiota bacterium]
MKLFLSEDKSNEDVTTLTTINKTVKMEAKIITEEECVVAGVSFLRSCFPDEISVDEKIKDGQTAQKSEILAVCKGSARTLLSRERVVLNLIQRLCGIATLTKQYSKIANQYNCKILDTRKMTPGLRLFEKYAVAVGDGFNHRMDLKSAVLIKDNHLLASGGVKSALESIRHLNGSLPMELEVDTLDQLKEGLEYKINRFLLDNMTPDEIVQAIALVKNYSMNNIFLEASGGITLETLEEYAATGIEAISIGALTTGAKNINLKMEFNTISE